MLSLIMALSFFQEPYFNRSTTVAKKVHLQPTFELFNVKVQNGISGLQRMRGHSD